MTYVYDVIEQSPFAQATLYSGPSLDAAMTEYRDSNGPTTLYRTADNGQTFEWLCMNGKTFLPC